MTDIPILETERLILREIRVEDFEPYAAFYETERSLRRGGPLNRARAWSAFSSEVGHWALRGYGFWSIEDKTRGDHCGMAGLYYPEGWPAREVGWLVWEQFEGKGIAYEASVRARTYAYETLGWSQIASCISEGNDRSIRLAERMGARFERRAPRDDLPDQLVYVHPKPDTGNGDA